jgi:hypothetical protein
MIINYLGQVCAVIALIFGAAKLAEWTLEAIARTFRAYRYFCEYIWHRKEFRRWLDLTCSYQKQVSTIRDAEKRQAR